MNDKEKTAELNRLIDELCNKSFPNDKNKINEWIQKLNEIYSNQYRHTYSKIFSKIQLIISEDDSEKLEILGENLNVLNNVINSRLLNNADDTILKNTSSSFKKFADHIHLEIGRYSFLKTHFSNNTNTDSTGSINYDDDIKSLNRKVDKISKDLNIIQPVAMQAEKELDNLDSKLESNKISSITTLTIFSAVVLAFSGGITFEAGVFKGMANSSSYRLVFTIALTGFILFNTIFMLLYLVGKLSGKNIGTKCKYWSDRNSNIGKSGSCGTGFCNKQCHSVSVCCRIFHKYSYVLFINIALIWIMYIDFFMWFFRKQKANSLHIFLQFVPIIVVALILVDNKIYDKVKLQRIKLKLKIGIIEDIVLPKENSTGIFSAILSINSLYRTKTDAERFTDNIKNDDFNTANIKLNAFINQRIFDNKDAVSFISSREHKNNKKRWKDLEVRFKDYISDNKIS